MNEISDGKFEILIEGNDPYLVEFNAEVSTAERMQTLHSVIAEGLKEQDRKRYATLQRSFEAMDNWSKLKRLAKSETRSGEPPALAEAVFSFLAPKFSADAELGDLQELFLKNVDRFGQARARRLYWYEVLQAVRPALFRIAKKLGIYGILVDYIRAKFNL